MSDIQKFEPGDPIFIKAEVSDYWEEEGYSVLVEYEGDYMEVNVHDKNIHAPLASAVPSNESEAYRLLDAAIANKCCACTENGDVCQPHEALALIAEHLDAKVFALVPLEDDEEFCEKCYAGTESDEHHEKCESANQ